MNVGVFLPNWIGDMVMATPALRSMRQAYPQARVTGVMRPHLSPVLAGSSLLDDAVFFDRRSKNPELSTRGTVRQLKQRKLDLTVLLTNTFTPAAVAWRSGIPRRAGYARYGRRLLLTHALPVPRDGRRLVPVSAVDYYMDLVRSVNGSRGSSQTPPLELGLTDADVAAADRVWAQCGFSSETSVVVMNTGGSYGTAKHWPIESFAELALSIVQETDCAVLVVCGPAEQPAALHVERTCSHPRIRTLAGDQPGIGLTKACIARSRLLVTTDSGPRHFAAAFGVPDISIFGATDPAWSDNKSPLSTHVRMPLECSPCGRRICPLGHTRCLTELSVTRVFQEVQRKLGHQPATRAA